MVMDRNKTFYENLLDNLAEGVCFVDRDKRITYWNATASRITGLEEAEVVGKSCTETSRQHLDSSGCIMCDGRCPLQDALETGEAKTFDLYLRHVSGQRVLVESRIQPVRDEEGKIVGAVELFLESASHRGALARLAELERLAMHDPLTGIANRRYLDQEFLSRFESFRRNGWTFGILVADIDRFKAINDTYGHPIGDKVIRLVAMTLAVNVRPFDLVGRWGGEEFVALLTTSNIASLAQVAERLRVLVEMSWLREEGYEIRATVSMGGAIVELEDTLESLFGRADAKLYQAKREGRNCVRV